MKNYEKAMKNKVISRKHWVQRLLEAISALFERRHDEADLPQHGDPH